MALPWTVGDGTGLLVLSRAGCREAGAIARTNVKLRDVDIAVRADDERCIEVVASGLPLFHGAHQQAVDITLRCALTSRGAPRTGAAREDGITCHNARADKAQKYAELLVGDRFLFVVVALETGERWSTEALEGPRCASQVSMPCADLIRFCV